MDPPVLPPPERGLPRAIWRVRRDMNRLPPGDNEMYNTLAHVLAVLQGPPPGYNDPDREIYEDHLANGLEDVYDDPPEWRQAAATQYATQYDNDYDPITDNIDVPMDLNPHPTPQFDDITLTQNTPPPPPPGDEEEKEEEKEDDTNPPDWGGRKYKRSYKKRRTRRRKTRKRKKTKRR